MKPKDLKAAFTWEKRRPLMADRVFYVPQYYSDHTSFIFPAWEKIFGNCHPVSVEFCSGNGDWIIERAKKNPEQNWVAVEMRFDRVRKIWSKMKNANLTNLFIVCGEAMTFSCHYIPEGSLEGVYINFPDPWPKARHEKHRLMKKNFLDELSRILSDKKSVTFVTDNVSYAKATFNLFEEHPNFKTTSFSTSFPDYGSSWFEALWKEKGREIYYGQYKSIS